MRRVVIVQRATKGYADLFNAFMKFVANKVTQLYGWKIMQTKYSFIAYTGVVIFLLIVSCSAYGALELNKSFGAAGLAEAATSTFGSRANGVVVQPDGKVVVAGSSSNSANYDFAVMRYLADGTFDSTFNSDGRLQTAIGREDDEALAVALLDDGRILAGGYSFNGSDRDFALACYQEDGTLDRSFGSEGIVTTPVGNSHDEITAIVTTDEGVFYVAGVVSGTKGRVVAVARYFDQGALDTSYGDGGIAILGVGDDAVVQDIIVQADHRVIVSGSYQQDDMTALLLLGLESDGTTDTSFGVSGIAEIVTDADFSEGYGMVASDSGDIYVAAAIGTNEQRDAALFRFSENGELDTSLNSSGYVVVVDGKEDDVLYDVKLLSSGKLVVGGYTTQAGVRKVVVATLSEQTTDGRDAGSELSSVQDEDSERIGAEDEVQVQEMETYGSLQEYLKKTGTGSSDSTDRRRQTIKVRALEPSSSLDAFLPETSACTRKNGRIEARTVYPVDKSKKHAVSLFQKTATVFSDFFVSSVEAAELGREEVKVIESERGDSVANRLAVTGEDALIVVGTATDDNDIDSAVVRALTNNRGSDVSGSQYIVTMPLSDINRTGALSGGTILSSLSGITRRGIVFSVNPNPSYDGDIDDSDDDSNDSSNDSSKDDGSDDNSDDGSKDDGNDNDNKDDDSDNDSKDDDKNDDSDDEKDEKLTVTITQPDDGEKLTSDEVTMEVTTSVDAICRYSVDNVAYRSMNHSFEDGVTTLHSVTLPLDDDTYTYYVRCVTEDRKQEVGAKITFTMADDDSTAYIPALLKETGNFFVSDALAGDDDTEDNEKESASLFSYDAFEYVEEGYTEDGSGSGIYSSRLEKLKPGTTYYVRAYALAGSTIYYGNQLSFTTDDACFIATAAYGSLFHPNVRILREFRDACLLKTAAGKELVNLYYTCSPALADQIAGNRILSLMVSLMLLPLVFFAWAALQAGLFNTLAGGIIALGVVYGLLRRRIHCQPLFPCLKSFKHNSAAPVTSCTSEKAHNPETKTP